MKKFCYGEIELEEGSRFNGVVLGISKKNREELSKKLPLNVHAKIMDRDIGVKTVVCEIDEDQL